jgi:ParB family chromosome partitioning protein
MVKQTGIAQFSAGRSDIHRIDPRKLVIRSGWNNREDTEELREHIEMLARSIAEVGVKVPIQVKLEGGEMVVKAGHCRTQATMLAISRGVDIKTVPVVSVDRYASDEDLILEQVITNSGKPFSPIEEARVYKKLLDHGWIQADIAKKSGKSQGRVSQILDLLTMPASVQALVAAGSVSPSLAQQTVKAAGSPQKASKQLQEAVDKAKSEGRKKVRPEDAGQERNSIKKCFDNSEIDSEDAKRSGFVTIKMPTEEFEFLRKSLKL